MHELIARQEVTIVTRAYSWIGFPLFTYRHYGIVSVCPTCASQGDEADRTYRKRAIVGICGFSLAIFGWQYVSLWGLVSAISVILGGAYWRKRRQKQLVQWRTKHHG
jgi:hypothetical protein